MQPAAPKYYDGCLFLKLKGVYLNSTKQQSNNKFAA